jgi:hypothetical protein
MASVVEATPALFERIPRGLFGPLGDTYAELYWDLLATLYMCEFEREPFLVLRPVALEIAENVIRLRPRAVPMSRKPVARENWVRAVKSWSTPLDSRPPR